MLNHAIYRWTICGAVAGAMLMLVGCSSSKPYTLVAQLPPLSQQERMVAATIDVADSVCSVRIVMLDSSKPWAPACTIDKDQPTYKSLTISGQEVDFGAVGDGFKVLNATLPTLPSPATSVAPAATKAKTTATQAPAAATAPVVASAGSPAFPNEWSLSPYAGHVKLEGQNTGFMVTSASISINGSECTLDVTFKTSYAPLHLQCTVIADQRGDFTLKFNPAESVRLSGGGSYDVLLNSEGAGISGNIWDSHGFDSWTPSLPPQWAAASYSSD